MPIENKIISNTATPSDRGIVSGRTSSSTSSPHTGTPGAPIEAGQIIKGEITDIRGKEVTIVLSDNTTLTGHMQNLSNLYIGQTTSFRVASVTQRLITLEGLLDNINNQENLAVRKALDEAGLPRTERNIQIVQELLNNRMPINKAMLQQIIQQSSAINNVSVDTIVLMNKYNLPVSQELATQFQNYNTGNHSLIGNIDILSENIPNLLTELASNADPSQVADFGGRLISIISEHLSSKNMSTLTGDMSTFSAGEKNELITYINEASSLIGSNTDEGNNIFSMRETITDGILKSSISPSEVNNYLQTIEKNLNILSDAQTNNGTMPFLNPQIGDKLNLFSEYLDFNNNALSQSMNESMRQELASDVSALINNNELITSIKNGSISIDKLLTTINSNLLSSPEAAAKLLRGEPFRTLFNISIRHAWTLTARELKKSDNITDYYRTMVEDLMKTTELIEKNLSGSASLALTNQTNTMNSNVNFMQDLNSLFQFIQLPIRFKEQTAHSELYVYTKKDELKRHPEKVSVLLHLDFEHLGTLDIHVLKEKNRVDTTFHCPDSSTANILKTNIQLLKDTLSSNGYIFNANVKETPKTGNPLQEFLNLATETDGQIPSAGTLNRYAFDLRA